MIMYEKACMARVLMIHEKEEQRKNLFLCILVTFQYLSHSFVRIQNLQEKHVIYVSQRLTIFSVKIF